MSIAGEQSVIEAVGSSQALRLQERLDRQLASMKREVVATVEQTVEDMVQERTQMVRSQILVNHAVLQKDVVALQSALSDLRLHTVAAGQEAEDQRRAAGVASHDALEEVRRRFSEMQQVCERSGAQCAELRADFSRTKEEVADLATRMQACDSLCKRCLSALDVSLGEVRRDFAALLQDMHSERDRSRLELGGRVGSAEAEIHRRIEEASAACKEASISEMRKNVEVAQRNTEHQVIAAQRRLEELVQDASREQNEQLQKKLFEASQQVVSAEASCRKASESSVEEAAAQLSRRLEESLTWAEATAGASQDVIEAELRSMEDKLESRQAEQRKEASAQLENFAGTVRHLEQATAWALRKLDESKNRAASDLRACTLKQEDDKERWHDIKEKVAEVQMAHFSLEGRQAKLERWHQTVEESRCSQQQGSAREVEALATELQAARGDWERKQLATQQSLEAILAEVGSRVPRAHHERQDRKADKAAEAALEAAVAAAAAEERAAKVSRSWETSHKQLEDVIGRLGEGMRRCVDEQQMQDRCCQDLQLKINRLENESLVAVEQLRQDSTQRLSNFRSQTRDDYDALEARLIAWSASQEDLAQRQESFCTQLDTTENRMLAEHKHLAAELDVSEARFLADQRAVLTQLHEFSKAQDGRMQRHSTKSNSRHEEAMHGLHAVRMEVMEATKQLVEGLYTEQSEAIVQQSFEISKLSEFIQDVESHADRGRSAGEAAVHELSRELHSEMAAAQDLWQELATSQDASMQELQANFHSMLRRSDETENIMLRRNEEKENIMLRRNEEMESIMLRRNEETESIMLRRNEAMENSMLRRNEETDNSMLRIKEEMENGMLRRSEDMQNNVLRKSEDMALQSAADAADRHAEAADRHVRIMQEVQMLDARIKEDMVVEFRACQEASLRASQEASASAMQRASLDCASLERTMLSQHESIQDRVSFAEESLLAVSRALHNEALEEVMATRFNCKAITESVRGEVLEEVLTTDDNCRSSVQSLRKELLEEVSVTHSKCRAAGESLRKEFSDHAASSDRAFARLECNSSGSAIAAAAASAAVEVRNEVLTELSSLQAQVKATDEQLLFLRAEVAPDVLCGVLRRDLAGSLEQVSAEQLSRFRKRWGGDVERKLDCIVQCLQSLHLKVGLPLRTLSTMMSPLRQGVEFEDLT